MTDMLNEREKTHGDWKSNSHVHGELLGILNKWETGLSDSQYVALVAILGKISRITVGDADFKDHWDDIIGYATLARDS